jgi:prepilin-type N-terminal cleavage/methylation domain-containing protein
MRAANDSPGFTLVEVAIAMAVIFVLMGSVFTITVQTSSFLSDTDTDFAVQTEGSRAFARLTDTLRKTGRVTVGGVAYPRVTGGGSELEFLILTDIDGNGYAFEEGTGKLEWDSRVFKVKTDAEGYLDIYHGIDKVYALGRYVTGLEFETIAENNTLHLKEIHVAFETRKTARGGTTMSFPVDGSIHMRN